MAAANAMSPDGTLYATIVGNTVRIYETGSCKHGSLFVQQFVPQAHSSLATVHAGSGRHRAVLVQQGSSQPSGTVAGDARAVIEPYTSIAWSDPGQVGVLSCSA